ncbi:MAG: WD40 repeat domain-containing protein [Pirellulales bacterium]|nr:WD40 repeat domain-containing protein [Pirellulales bacterium]
MFRKCWLWFLIVPISQTLFLTLPDVCQANIRFWVYQLPGERERVELYAEYVGVEQTNVLLKGIDGKIHRVPITSLDSICVAALERFSRTETAAFHEWTDSRGKKFEARYSGITKNGIMLTTREGTVVSYSWNDLDAKQKQLIVAEQQVFNAARLADREAARKWRQLENGVRTASLRLPDAFDEIDKQRGDHRFIRQLVFSPDSNKLFASFFGSPQRIWNLTTYGSQVVNVYTPMGSRYVCFSPDGQYLWDCDYHYDWHRTNLAMGSILEKGPDFSGQWKALLGERKVSAMAFSPKGTIVAMGLVGVRERSSEVALMDPKTGKVTELLVPGEKSDQVIELLFSFDGNALAANLDDDRFHAWRLQDNKRLTLSLEGQAIQLVDNGSLVVQRLQNRLRLCRIADGGVESEITLGWEGADTSPVTVAPVGRLAVAAYGPALYLFDWTNSEYFERIAIEGDWITNVQFSPDGKCLATGDASGSIRLWKFDELCRSSDVVATVELKTQAALPTNAGQTEQTSLGDESPSEEPSASIAGKSGVCLRLPGKDHANVLAWSPDGKTLATGGYDESICLWDAATGKKQGVLKTTGSGVSALLFSPDGDILASVNSGYEVSLWNLSAKTMRKVDLDVDDHGHVLSFSPDGHLLAVACAKGLVTVLPVAAKGKNIILRDHGDWATSVCFSPDGRLLAVGGDNKNVRVWDTANWQTRYTLEGHKESVRQVAFSPSGRFIASLGDDPTVRLWDSTTGRIMVCFEVAYGSEDHLAFSPDESCLAVSEYNNLTLRKLDAILSQVAPVSEDPAERLRQQNRMATPVPVEPAVSIRYDQVPSRKEQFEGVSFSPDGSIIATVDDGGDVWLWDVASLWTHRADAPRRVLCGRDTKVTCLAVSPDSRIVVSGDYDETVRLWDMLAGTELAILRGHNDSVQAVAMHPSGQMVASGSDDDRVILWDIPSRREIARLNPLGGDVHSLAFSADGQSLLVGGEGKELVIVDTKTCKERISLPPVGKSVDTVAFSPDSQYIAFSRYRTTQAEIRDARTGILRHTIAADDEIHSLVFSADSMWLALADDSSSRIYDVSTGDLVKSFGGDASCIGISPDRQLIVAGSSPKIHVWNTQTDKLQGLFGEDDKDTGCLLFSPDGKWLIAGRSDYAIYVWNVKAYSNLYYGVGISENMGLLVGRLFANAGFLDPTLGTRLVLTKAFKGYALSMALPNGGWNDSQIVKAVLDVAKQASEQVLQGPVAVRLCDEDLNIRRVEVIGDPAVAHPFACLNTTESNPQGDQVLIEAKEKEE